MTADVANLLAEIRHSGGDVRLISGDRLKLIARKALLPELTDRVRAAKPMLLATLADTAPVLNPLGLGVDRGEPDLDVLGPERN